MQMYNDPSVKPWTSGSYAPPGYANRYSAAATQDKVSPDQATLVERVSQEGSPEKKVAAVA